MNPSDTYGIGPGKPTNASHEQSYVGDNSASKPYVGSQPKTGDDTSIAGFNPDQLDYHIGPASESKSGDDGTEMQAYLGSSDQAYLGDTSGAKKDKDNPYVSITTIIDVDEKKDGVEAMVSEDGTSTSTSVVVDTDESKPTNFNENKVGEDLVSMVNTSVNISVGSGGSLGTNTFSGKKPMRAEETKARDRY
ncbi:hypothetical protein HOD83_03735 [Candidatus Woesearchaeota archaeon]|jgi:hypothetical protein|nr:hypothetical protein [Candidatus Woesearchaeota archaeon]MBT4114232.1 hypothetical protein [Candidatus Woesearchaeota archaeon]MBT4248664.1 hypothetical protein [Candidatus Woesearchaeota archaeon]